MKRKKFHNFTLGRLIYLDPKALFKGNYKEIPPPPPSTGKTLIITHVNKEKGIVTFKTKYK